MTASNKILALAFTLVPAIVATSTTQSCVNSDSFRYFYVDMERSCKNIRINNARREDLCTEAVVSQNCPQACGICCENIEGFTFTRTNGLTGDCAWIAQKEQRKERYCEDTEKTFDGRTVRDGCPVACDFCQTKVAVATISPAPTITLSAAPSGAPSTAPTGKPTTAPSSKPSSSPTESPTRPPSPMPSPFPTSRPTFTPSVSPSRKPSASPSDGPSLKPSQGPSDLPSVVPSQSPSDIPSAVPSLEPSLEPSASPSDKPSLTPSQLPSLIPSASPSDIPSVIPSVAPTGKPSVQPSDQPSNKPTTSIKPSSSPSAAPVGPTPKPTSAPSASPSVSPVACINNGLFDFALVNEDKNVTCAWITKNNVEARRTRYCGNADVAAACRQACGSCVADDDAYTFKMKNYDAKQNCAWLTKNLTKTATRIAEYCSRGTVSAGCADTCA